MATTPKKLLLAQIKGANPGPDKRRRDGYLDAMSNLLDTAQRRQNNRGARRKRMEISI